MLRLLENTSCELNYIYECCGNHTFMHVDLMWIPIGERALDLIPWKPIGEEE